MVMKVMDFLGADPAQEGIKPETLPDTGNLFSPRQKLPRLVSLNKKKSEKK